LSCAHGVASISPFSTTKGQDILKGVATNFYKWQRCYFLEIKLFYKLLILSKNELDIFKLTALRNQ
jgi:hypothetical protein